MLLNRRRWSLKPGPWFALTLASVVFVLLLGVLFGFGQGVVQAGPGGGSQAGAQGATGIAVSVVKAPVVPDGNVAGAPTDIVISLDRSLDPSVPGRSLLQGNQIRVTLPDAFVNVRGYPGATIFTPGCVAPALTCNSGILLQGWPQHPIFPMFPPGSGPPAFYETTLEGTNTIVFTALQDVVPGLMLPGPGIKQIHLFAVGFDNPAPGFYDIQVDAQTGPGGAWESGSARVQIFPNIRPSINVTSVFNGAGNPNTIYQQTTPGAPTPLPYHFLMWDSAGAPLDGVTLEMVSPGHALMTRGDSTVGHAYISAPEGATGHHLTALEDSVVINGPLFGIPTARLTAQFTAGSAAGRYEVTFALNNGNSVTMFVDVN